MSEHSSASRRRDIQAICLLCLAVLALVSLHSNAAGIVGSYLAYALRTSVGQAADLPPIFAAMFAIALLRERRRAGRQRKACALALLFAVLVTMLQIVEESRVRPPVEVVPAATARGGGMLGEILANASLQAFGRTGSAVVLTALCLIAAVLYAETPVARLLETLVAGAVAVARTIAGTVAEGFGGLVGAMRDAVNRWRDNWAVRQARKKRKQLQARPTKRVKSEARTQAAAASEPVPEPEPEPMPEPAPAAATATTFTDPFQLPATRRKQRPAAPEPAEEQQAAAPRSVTADDAPVPEPVIPPPTGAEQEIVYQLPPVSLFQRPKERDRKRAVAAPDQRQQLEETLATFGVQAKVVSVSRGPVITRYELQPAPGVAVKRITSLADDLALNLAAAGVRIEAPVPGKSVVGIEVPNKETALVTFREVVESEDFTNAKSRLAIVIGTDIAGNAVVGDLTKWLHLLIAGATGSGKSVCINSIICSLLMRAKPHEVKLLLIDPKRVELAVYDGIPHLISPVVTDPKLASGALRWAVREMESRFKQFAERGVRNIDGYNQLVAQEEPSLAPMPYIVVIIDELADLMMVAKAEVEDSICRLAQMARAAGMYLIVATQRPSVDVITGLIKANVPSRISFAVSSGVDSRTILDQVGAERLLGKGDMLYHPIGAPKPVRAQGAFISDHEVQTLVDYWKAQGTPEYQEAVLADAPGDSGVEAEEVDDELFADACRLVVETGNASISMLQRRFRVGYARAARLIDMMELRGIVGPYQGSKPREVLRTMDELEEMSL